MARPLPRRVVRRRRRSSGFNFGALLVFLLALVLLYFGYTNPSWSTPIISLLMLITGGVIALFMILAWILENI